MRWEEGRRSENVEDQRGAGGRRGPVVVGGGMGMIVFIIIALVLGVNPLALLQQQGGPGAGGPPGQNQPGQNQPQAEGRRNPAEERAAEFVSAILADTEDVWTEIFADRGARYRKPKLVLFSGQVRSACGFADAAVGPFYCPEDEKVYIDLAFFNELQTRFRAPGDFAQAYVIAHEIGHHVQKQLGITDKVHSMQGRISKADYNKLSVRLELQADFFAGVWAHHAQKARNLLEEGDIEEGLRAASAIGDDKLQREAQGYVVPDSFTHGSSAQRVRWFRKGLQSGDIDDGDTFNTDEL